MATIHGYKSLENKNLIVYRSFNDNAPSGMCTLTVQVDQSLLNFEKVKTGEKKADSNPYLTTMTLKNGFVTHALRYTEKQFEQIKKAAGDNIRNVSLSQCSRKATGQIYGINASLVITENGFAIDTTKPMTETKNHWFGMNTLVKQNEVTKAAKEYRKLVKSGLTSKQIVKQKDDGLSL